MLIGWHSNRTVIAGRCGHDSAQMRASGLVGIHLDVVMFAPTLEEVADATEQERRMLDDVSRCDRGCWTYMKAQMNRPRSVAFALADASIGLAS